MGRRRRNLFVLLFVGGLIAVSALVIATKQTRLGLDLRGGVELVYQGQPTPQQPQVTQDAIDRSLEIIRQRTDKLGVSEPEISRLGRDQITVGLPDVSNAQRAIDQVGTTAQMFFYDWEPNVIAKPGATTPAEAPFTNLYEAVKLAAKQKAECRGCTEGPRLYLFDSKSHRLLAGPETSKRDLFSNQKGGKQPPNSEILTVPQGVLVIENVREKLPGQKALPAQSWFVIRDRPSLSGKDIKDPKQQFDPTTNQPNVSFDFSGEGRRKFHDVTRVIAQRGLENHVPGNPPDQDSGHFAVVLDNKIVSRPIINFQENPDGIDGRTGAQISGSFTIQQAQDLADFLKIGALPIKLKLISQTQVSATLGKQALNEGLRAGAVGLLIVVLFLILYYRLLGLIASSALAAYGVIFFALIKLIPITLTLPGIAGLILTIGVAADSNIVIFERIKEEIRAGRSTASAIAAGYKRGIATIVDANVVTVLTAFVLFVLATAGVKGFAFTLLIGTLVSLLTAVVFTQAVLGSMGRTRLLSSPIALGAARERLRWHFNFMGASRWFFSMSGMILIVGAVALATLQLNLGIDFKSGTRAKIAVTKPTDENGILAALSSVGINGESVQRVKDPGFGANVFQVQTRQLAPEQVGRLESAIDRRYGIAPGKFDSQSVGPTFGKTVAKSAIYAIIFSLLVIGAYVALRFDPKFAIPVLIALFHDILITAGVYSLTDREVTSSTVAAFLTILGFSLYDTIIVFDRIRENVPRLPRAAFSQIVNRSMSEVLTRSLATSFSTLLPVLALLLFGGTTLKDFAFALLVGIASGTYSSIFIASPVLTAWKEREPTYRRKRQRILDQMGEIPAFPEENVGLRAEDELASPAAETTDASDGDGAVSEEPEALVDDGGEADGADQPLEDRPIGSRPIGSPPGAEGSNGAKRNRRQRRRKHGRPR
ncbi:MAG: SecD/SecF fusion protein [Solirubrobacterales bacterium]|nr:SecD/SecF fusion protein [Solirubrobacterales bacterium]